MILEARNDVARCQHIIAQQNNQITYLQIQMQIQGAGLSIVWAMISTSSYSKKVEIFNDPEKYDGSKVKFEEWWAKIQAWLTVNQHTIPAGLQDAIGTVLSWLKGPKAGPFTQLHLMQVAQRIYSWNKMVSNIEGLFQMTNKKDWARKELQELKQGKLPTDDFIMKWEALYLQVEVDNSHTVELLKRNTAPDTISRIFQEGKQMEDLIDYLK